MGKRFTYYNGPLLACSAEGLAFIAAHELATGVSMGAIQKAAICGFVSRLQGNNTTNGSDLWSGLVSRGSSLFPLTPTDDSTATAAAYNIDLVSATAKGTYVNYLAGDFTADGVTSSVTKYFDTGEKPNAWSQNSIGTAFYIKNTPTINSHLFGSRDVTGTRNHWATTNFAATSATSRISGNANVSGFPTALDGLFHFQRKVSIAPIGTTVARNGVILTTTVTSSVTPPDYDLYIMARNNAGSTLGQFAGTTGGWAYNLTSMDANEIQDFSEAWEWYQANVITGGR